MNNNEKHILDSTIAGLWLNKALNAAYPIR